MMMSIFYSEGNENKKTFKQRNTLIKAIASRVQFDRDVQNESRKQNMCSFEMGVFFLVAKYYFSFLF